MRKSETERTIPLLEKSLSHKIYSEKNNINIEHDVDKYLGEMLPLTADELKLWKRNYAILTHKLDGDCILHIQGYENIHPLDALYNLSILSKQGK